MLPSHDRFSYSPITSRHDFTWPGGKRLAVYLAVCIEHFGYGQGGLGLSYSPDIPHPNTYNWGWREYGNRVGGWRLLDMLNEFGITPTALVNSECYEHCPELLSAYRAAGTEFVGHGRTNSEVLNGLSDDEQRRIIREVTETIASAEGRAPRGWMSPGANPSRELEDLLAEAGYIYTLDWPIDEQPTWLHTRGGPLLSVPYPHEVNDVPFIAFHHGTAEQFADMVTDAFDELAAQALTTSLVYGVVVHTFIAGQPHRLRRLREAFRHVMREHDQIWLTTPGEIAEFYRKHVELPPSGAPAASESVGVHP